MAHSHADLKTHILAQQKLIAVTSDSVELCQCRFQKCIQIPFTATGGWVKIFLPASFPHCIPQCLNKRGAFKEEGAKESWPTIASSAPSLLTHHARVKGTRFGGKARAGSHSVLSFNPAGSHWVLQPTMTSCNILCPNTTSTFPIALKMQPPHSFLFLQLKTSILSTQWDKPILEDDQYEFR